MTIVFWQVVVGLIEGDDRYILYQAAIYRVGLRLACFNFEVNFKSRNEREFCQKEMWVNESAPSTLFTYTARPSNPRPWSGGWEVICWNQKRSGSNSAEECLNPWRALEAPRGGWIFDDMGLVSRNLPHQNKNSKPQWIITYSAIHTTLCPKESSNPKWDGNTDK